MNEASQSKSRQGQVFEHFYVKVWITAQRLGIIFSVSVKPKFQDSSYSAALRDYIARASCEFGTLRVLHQHSTPTFTNQLYNIILLR